MNTHNKLIIILIICLGFNDFVFSQSSANISLTQFQLVPTYSTVPEPQGIVDENSPWLHVNIPLYNESDINSVRNAKIARLKFQRRFYFELSQDATFKSNVYKSGPKRWGFYNPYEHLKVGKWYWKYGVADPDTPDKPVWDSKIYSFEITGKERLTPIPPKPDEIVNAVISRPAPVFSMFREELGKLLPEQTWPELASWVKEAAEKKYAENKTMSFTLSNQYAIDNGYVDQNGNYTGTRDFFKMKINAEMLILTRYINDLMAAYAQTGDTRYRDRAIQKTREEWDFFNTAKFYIGFLNETLEVKKEVYTGFPYSYSNFIEICPEVLTEAEKKEIINGVYPSTWSAPEDMEYAEHVVYDQHMWQDIMEKLKRSITFARYKEEAREELKWAYELWLYRAPALSRTDGGTLEGDGYLGVHDNYLGVVPWLIYKLTGYNYINAQPWYANHAKYLNYINPFGNAGNGYCDGDTGGATMPYTMEVLAHLSPENYWNLWRFKIIPQKNYKSFASDLGKGDRAFALLSLWKYIKTPDLSGLQPSKVLAEHFRDVGEVGMHTDLGNERNNFQATMHSGPYGSSMHLHPCQNAFEVAYGGQDLFWKTGFYNGGDWHNQLSYKNSRAHNTIIANGMVQGFNWSSYGWMPRFVHGDKISYALGDASNAYNDENNYKDPKLKDANGNFLLVGKVPYTAEYGFGNPGVTKFRRHMVMLRPNYLLIYDELESKEPITWEFRLHSRRWMTQLDQNSLMGANDYATASAKMFCKYPINTSLKWQYLKNEKEVGYVKPAPQDAWLMRPLDDENKLPKPIPEHYHGAFTTPGKHSKMRFLTVLEIHPGKTKTFVPQLPVATGDNLVTIKIGSYTVNAQLDANQPTFLKVVNDEGTAAFVTGDAAQSITLGTETKTAAIQGSTLLLEKNTYKGDIFIEAIDTIPDILKYGNMY